MNRDQYLSDSLAEQISLALPKWNQLFVFEGGEWDKYSKYPYIYLHMPTDLATSEDYDNGDSDTYEVTTDIIAYFGFKSKTDATNKGLFQQEFWERANEIQTALRRLDFDDYSNETESVYFNNCKYKGKELLLPNNGNGVGLGVIHFQINSTVVLK